MAENQCFIPLLGLCHFCHDCTNDEGVNDAAHNALEHHHKDSHWALLRYVSEAITDRRLSLNGEQEGTSEATNIGDTWMVIIF